MTSFSSSHTVAKVLNPPTQLHLLLPYPMRFAWDLTFDYLRSSKLGRVKRTRYLLHQMRQWDVLTANRVDFIANSQKHSSSHLALLPPPSNSNTRRSILSDFPFDLKTRFLRYRFPIGEL